jgi:hypothetical protein
MVSHQDIFRKIRDLLSRHTTIKVDELDYGTHLAIDNTGIWLEFEPDELTIGYWLAHRHYNSTNDDLRPALDKLFNLLTKRKRITLYSKGGKVFKEKIEIQLSEQTYEQFGVSMTLLFPFWRRTTKAVAFEEPLIDASKIEDEVNDIYGLLDTIRPKAPSA